MKRTFRLTALVMALLMLVNISALATTEGISVYEFEFDNYVRIFQSAVDAAQNQNADTADVDDETDVHHWAYVKSNNAELYNAALYDAGEGLNKIDNIPAASWVKAYKLVNGAMYLVEYKGNKGYVYGSTIATCRCNVETLTDTAIHLTSCNYRSYIDQFAIYDTADQIYGRWDSFSSGEQAYLLAYLKENYTEKYKDLVALLPQTKTETAHGTTVSVTGNIPADVTLELAPADTAILSSILPGIDLQTAQYFALDVKLMQGDNSEWQPTDDQKITVTISANNVGTEGQYVALYHNHDGVTDSLGLHQITNGNLTFQIDGFSYVFGVNAHSSSCKYDELSAMETPAKRYEFLMQIKNVSYTEYEKVLWEYKLEHLDSGLLCNCNLNDFSPKVYAPGSAEHAETCPWHESKLPQKENVSDTVEDTDITVSVNGTFPESVKLNVREAADEELAAYISSIPSIFRRLQLEINLMDANNQVWQHNGSMQVTISTSTLGETGDTIALYRIHNGVVEFIGTTTVTDGSIIFNVDDFSYVMGVNVSDDCTDGADCGYAGFESKTIAEKETALAALYNQGGAAYGHFEYHTFIAHVKAYHVEEANICLCDSYNPSTNAYAYGSLSHTGYQVMNDKYPCPWAFNQIPVVDQAEILKDKTEEEREDYLETLSPEQKVELEAVLNEVTMLKNALIVKYSQEAIDTWFADIEPDPTVEMMRRALNLSENATSLHYAVIEDDTLYSVYTGQPIATYNAETGIVKDIASGLEFHINELTAGSNTEQN